MKIFLLFSAYTLLLLVSVIMNGGPNQNFKKAGFPGLGMTERNSTLNLSHSKIEKKDTLHIHFLSGCEEYHSEHSLKRLKQTLEQEFENVKVTASWGRDSGNNLPNIDKLANADLLVVFTRRMTLPMDQMVYIFQYIGAEKPIIGIRTASHAFQTYLYFDNQVFGGDYQNHGPDERVKVTVAKNEGKQLILNGVDSTWTRPGKLYKNPNMGPHTQTLLYGKGFKSETKEPLAWTNIYGKKGRAFYTSMGQPSDFTDKNFRQLLLNAINWASSQDLYQNHKEKQR